MLPADVRSLVEEALGASIEADLAVGGGCISHATHLRTRRGDYFLKWSRDDVAATFPPEAVGLEALREAGSPLIVPRVVLVRGAGDGRAGLLLMEWLETGLAKDGFWEEFARGLASLHRHTADRYGFGEDNYIGRLPQQNDWGNSWPEFFLLRRIEPQVRMARQGGSWDPSWNAPLERLTSQIESILPKMPEASILHGDFWGGNFLVTAEGRAALVDPAAYFGHREADLAMTELFGGFDRRFYDAYREAYSLEPGYQERREIYNLYHLINHLNHFGGGYGEAVARVMKKFNPSRTDYCLNPRISPHRQTPISLPPRRDG